MDINIQEKHLVAVVGAGPAGLFATRELAVNGNYTVLFNRDIKPGGLAEYGIFPDKHKMKEGLRNQFRQILALDNVEYYGNVHISNDGDLTLEDLRTLGFQAILITAGAQGAISLGIPGENLSGVYQAKDLVYHYNMLPPYGQIDFPIGKRIAIIGAGNVMVDICHYMIDFVKVEEVFILVRRGPAEVKFDKKELESIVNNVDLGALEEEIQRVTPSMLALGEDPTELPSMMQSILNKAAFHESKSHVTFYFLSCPVRILANKSSHVSGLVIEDTTLFVKDGVVKAKGLGSFHQLEVDTVIFAIGNVVDEHVGLPVKGNEFIKNLNPRFPIEGETYEVCLSSSNCLEGDVFVAGWSRKANTGVVGIARRDGINCARAVMQYLAALPPLKLFPLRQIQERLMKINHTVVNEEELKKLEFVEHQRAQEFGLEEFKFNSNAEMLQAIGKNL